MVPQPVLQVAQVKGAVTVGVTLGQHLPTQPSVTVFKTMQSGAGPQVRRGQWITPVAGTVVVGHARVVMVVRGHAAAACARQGERKLFWGLVYS